MHIRSLLVMSAVVACFGPSLLSAAPFTVVANPDWVTSEKTVNRNDTNALPQLVNSCNAGIGKATIDVTIGKLNGVDPPVKVHLWGAAGITEPHSVTPGTASFHIEHDVNASTKGTLNVSIEPPVNPKGAFPMTVRLKCPRNWPPPTVTGAFVGSPARAAKWAEEGTVVTLRGQFGGVLRVVAAPTTIPFTLNGARDELTFTVPHIPVRAVNLVIVGNGGEAQLPFYFGIQRPHITSATVAAGEIAVLGEDFRPNGATPEVKLGTITLTLKNAADGSLTAMLPKPAPPGFHNLTVKTAGGSDLKVVHIPGIPKY